MTDEQDGCNIDFSELDRDQLEQLAGQMHVSLHEYADEQEQIRQWIVGLGYGLDTLAGEVVENNGFGKRKSALEELAAQMANFATLAYKTAGITRADVAEAIEFSAIVDMFVDGPEFHKEN